MFKRGHIWGVFLCISMGLAQFAESQVVADSFPAPGSQPRGLAWDGSFLWNADAGDTVYQIDPSSGTVVSSFYFSIDSAFGGITWGWDEKLWIANGIYIHQVDAATGESLYSFHCPGG